MGVSLFEACKEGGETIANGAVAVVVAELDC